MLLLSLTGCLQDKCGSISCENGICVDGRCACQFGFEGEFCDEPWYAKFLGEWDAVETKKGDSLTNAFKLNAQFSRVVDTFKISGFAASWGEVFCVRESSTTFKILEKEVDSVTKLVSGEGTISNDLTKVTGVYSFTKQDKDTLVNFSWNK